MSSNKTGIHETVLNDIVNAIVNADFKNILGNTLVNAVGRKNNVKNFSSIAKATSNLVLTFPVIVDETVPINTAKIITKAVERKAVVMLQLLFSAISAQELKNDENVFDLISKVHSNLNGEDIEDYIKKMESIDTASESALAFDEFKDIIIKDNKEIDNYTLSAEFPKSIQEQFEVDMSTGKVSKKYIPYNEVTDRVTKVPELMSTDTKRANEDIPTLLAINFYTKNRDAMGTAVIGIKAKLQYVYTQEMITRIITKNKDKNGLFNFLRSTTREISFFKDFLFAIDKAKLDAINVKSSQANPIWKLLERRAAKSKINSYLGSSNEASAITTLVISSDTAEQMKKEFGFKSSPAEILSLMSSYNLMAFYITDDVKERAYSIYDDGSRNFEVQSYTALEKEDSNSYKKIINLLTK